MSNYDGPTYGEIKAEDDAREALAAARRAREDENPMGVTYNIAPGGCVQPTVGDFPPFTPYGPVPPVYPGQSLPNSGKIITTTDTTGKKKDTTMDVYLIWAMVPESPDSPWVVSAWDSEARAGNEDGWLEDLANQEETYGARYIRVTRTVVNYDRVVAAFEPVDV